MKLQALGDQEKRRNHASLMSDSEIITMIGFHLGAHKTFKHYYQQIVCGY